MTAPRRRIFPTFKKEQAERIVEFIEKGVPSTLLGEMLGITRERVGQVYFKMAGKSIPQFRQEQKIKDLENYFEKTKRQKICKRCKEKFLTRKGNQKFCSGSCRKAYYEDNLRQQYKEFKEWKKKNDRINF